MGRMKTLQAILDRLLTAPGETPGALTRRDEPRAHVPETSHTVYLLLDISSSMDAGKLAQARRGGLSFAKDAIEKGYRVGVIQFSTLARISTEPTTTLGLIRSGLSEIGVQLTTNMAAAIELATTELRKTRGSRAMVLVTDGYPDSEGAAIRASWGAKNSDITIIAIGTEDADRGFLKKIATASELATTVPDSGLEVAISSASRLLPERTSGSR